MSLVEIAGLAHLRRARDYMDRNYAQCLIVPVLARRVAMSAAAIIRAITI